MTVIWRTTQILLCDFGGYHGHDCMVDKFNLMCVIHAYHHLSHPAQRQVHSYNVMWLIKIVSELQQVSGFLKILKLPHLILRTYNNNITGMLLKLVWNTCNSIHRGGLWNTCNSISRGGLVWNTCNSISRGGLVWNTCNSIPRGGLWNTCNSIPRGGSKHL